MEKLLDLGAAPRFILFLKGARKVDTDKIKRYIESHRDDMVRDLAGFIAIPSVSEDRAEVSRALDYVLQLAKRMGFEAESVLDHRVGVISTGAGEETIGILAHVDVVPPGDAANWNTPPFQMTESDGRLYGRGTLDDKGAIIASLYAMKYLLDCGAPIRKKVQMILGTQEEVEWEDMDAYVRSYPLPDYGFTPDGEFPLCNIEKGLMTLELRLPLKQPDQPDQPREDGWYLEDLKAGTAANIVPGQCTAVLKRVCHGEAVEETTVKTEGRAVHSCQPEKGKNAIFVMADTLKDYPLQENQLWRILRMLQEKFADLYGKALGLYSESEYYNGEFVHRNVFSPNVISVKGDMVSCVVDVRFAYGTAEADIIERMRAAAAEIGGTSEVQSSLPAVYVSRDRPFMDEFGLAYEEGSGRKHQCVLAYGGSYAKAMPNIVSWGPIFPGEEDTCHEDNEYIAIDTLLTCGKVFAIALARTALSERCFK